jgi:hypothetical protein
MSSIESIQKENAELRKIVKEHADEIERCKGVVYQLVGGLFNQKTQKGSMDSLLNVLDRTSNEPEEYDEEGNESIWPTTRQGDNHENRMRKMEETIQKLEKQVEILEKRQTGVCLKY